MVPLAFVKPGKKVKIAEIKGGKGVYERLLSMGLVPGREVIVLRNGPGPIVVKVGESRVGMGFGVGRKILVEEE
jgi:ferrous iron transport protein A